MTVCTLWVDTETMEQRLMCAECGGDKFTTSGPVVCTYCGSTLVVLAEQPPAVVDYRDRRDPDLDSWEGEGGR